MENDKNIPDNLLIIQDKNIKQEIDIFELSENEHVNESFVESSNVPVSQRSEGKKSESPREINKIDLFKSVDAWGFFFDLPSCECWSEKNRIYFNGEVFESSMNILIKEFKKSYDYIQKLASELEQSIDNFTIELYITSRGGSILEGFRFIDFVKTLPKIRLKTIAIGYVASMGFILWLMSEDRYITENAHVLIHQLRGGIGGRRDEMIDYWKHLEDIHRQLIEFIKVQTGMNEEKVNKLMTKETWLTSEETRKLGLGKIYNSNS